MPALLIRAVMFGSFRSETGQSPAKAIENLRVEAARILMEEAQHPVDVIARETGFPIPSGCAVPSCGRLASRLRRSSARHVCRLLRNRSVDLPCTLKMRRKRASCDNGSKSLMPNPELA